MPKRKKMSVVRELLLENPSAPAKWVVAEARSRYTIKTTPSTVNGVRCQMRKDGEIETNQTELVHSPDAPFEQAIKLVKVS